MLTKLDELLVPPDPNIEYDCSNIRKSKGFTLLMKLVLLTKEYPELNGEIKKYITGNKSAVNKSNEKGWTSLMLACRNSNIKSTETTIKMLIDAGADLNLKNNDGRTALMMACRNSTKESSENTVKMLIDGGADINLKEPDGWTALMFACRYSNTDSTENTVKMLIDGGADVNLTENNEWTALIFACRYSNTDSTENTVKMLIEVRSDVNLKTNDGWTALMVACKFSKDNIVKILINADAQISIKKISIMQPLKSTRMKIIIEHYRNNVIKEYIKKSNYINVIKHIPYLINNFRFKFGGIYQKISQYEWKLRIQNIPNEEIFNEIQKENKIILDYLDIYSPNEINKLSEFVNFWQSNK